MLVHDEEANQIYCSFKFSQCASAEVGRKEPKWTCEGLKWLAWKKIGKRVGGEGVYCGLAEKSSGIDWRRRG